MGPVMTGPISSPLPRPTGRRVLIGHFLAVLALLGAGPVSLRAQTTAAETPAPASAPLPVLTDAPGFHDTHKIFDLKSVHRIEINISSGEWAVLQQSNSRGGGAQGGTDYTDSTGRLIHVGSGFGGYYPWVKADVRFADEDFPSAGIRYRGNSSFSRSSAAAPLRANLKLKLDVFEDQGKWHGVKTLNFNAGNIDYTLMREAIGFALFRAAGVPAPRTAFAELVFTVPNIYDARSGGAYVMIENVNKDFLEDFFGSDEGLLMKPERLSGGVHSLGMNWSSYVSIYRPESEATPEQQARVMTFAQVVSQDSVEEFRRRIGDYLDVDEFLRFIAVNAFLENWDSYIGNAHNYYIYLDPTDNRFRFIPWDLDLSMGSSLGGRGGRGNFSIMTPYSGSHPLIYYLLDDPEVKARYRDIIRELAATAFSPETINALCDTVEEAIGRRSGSPRSYLLGQSQSVARLIASWE